LPPGNDFWGEKAIPNGSQVAHNWLFLTA